ncbi:hypothetical protein P280DRAFT_37900 [Massarina eburnea CBS 473.64]|uniref:Uncharacterized protein n=1 Tax=Massarina eburnea CBS 473.64 TaxID=1395130 RepID=A0A6A6RWR7_9PLEO|nr:hypothetical protein P280DRAFT_37900 [Massarina eburnea CBS 473.64]
MHNNVSHPSRLLLYNTTSSTPRTQISLIIDNMSPLNFSQVSHQTKFNTSVLGIDTQPTATLSKGQLTGIIIGAIGLIVVFSILIWIGILQIEWIRRGFAEKPPPEASMISGARDLESGRAGESSMESTKRHIASLRQWKKPVLRNSDDDSGWVDPGPEIADARGTGRLRPPVYNGAPYF